MKVLVTGATGMIGREIVKELMLTGYKVCFLTTSVAKLDSIPKAKGFLWNPSKNEIDETCFEGVKTIIHLAGSSIAKRWTKSYKARILKSRTVSAKLLFTTLEQIQHNVTHFISASAVGKYPPSLSNYYTEDMPETANNFLGEVVEKWEAAADMFKTIGINVCKIRIGLVLSAKGGALEKLVTPIKYYIGAPLASGKQWQSWIHLQDLVAIFVHALRFKLEGVYNAVAPEPVTNQELTKAIAKQLNKPILPVHIPAFLLYLMLGEMAVMVTEGQYVSAEKILNEKFYFQYSNVHQALKNILVN